MEERRSLAVGLARTAADTVAVGVDEREVTVTNQILQLLRSGSAP